MENRSVLDATTEIVVAALARAPEIFPDQKYAEQVANFAETIYEKLSAVWQKLG